MVVKRVRGISHLRVAGWHSSRRGVRAYIEVVIQSLKDTSVDNGTQWAAAVAYYALLSAVPVLLVLASVVSFVAEPQWAIDRITNLLGDFFPQSEDTVEDIVNGAIAVRRRVGVFAFLILLWTGTRAFDSLTRAMNVAFDVDDTYGALHRIGIQIAMLLTVGVFFLLALASGLLIGPVWEAMRGSPTNDPLTFLVITWVLRLVLLFVAYALIYRLVPRRRCHMSAVAAGAATATVLSLVATGLFRGFIEWSETYDLLYGPLAVVVILMVWVGIVSFVTVFGGEVVSHAQEMLIDGRTAEDVGQRHASRSPRQRPMEGNVPNPRDATDAVRDKVDDYFGRGNA